MISARDVSLSLAALAVAAPIMGARPAAAQRIGETIPVRVVVVTTFEVEENGQDQGGEKLSPERGPEDADHFIGASRQHAVHPRQVEHSGSEQEHEEGEAPAEESSEHAFPASSPWAQAPSARRGR